MNTFRSAGIAGILSAVLTVVSYLTSDPSSGIPLVWALASATAGIILVAGLYLLYRGAAPALSLTAGAISVIGYLLFVTASWMQVVFPSPVLVAADVAIYILGLSLFSWLAYRTQQMPRGLALVGFLAALAGAGSYLMLWGTGADVTDMANLPPLVMAFFTAYLVGVIAWLAWTGIALLRRAGSQPAAASGSALI